jgi:purine nucleosidase
MNKTPLLIDADPAIGYWGRDVDDGLAILALLADPRVEVLGVTVTFGNVSLSRGLYKAKELLRRAGREDVPVLAGARDRFALDKETEASSFLVDASLRYREQLQVLAIGPLTNIATAAVSYGFFSRLRSLMVLGGTLSAPASWTQQAGFEFNLRQDLAAARRVFLHGERMTIFPMEPCRTVSLGWPMLLRMLRSQGATRWAAQQSILWEALSPLLWASCGFHPWDVLAGAALVEPDLFTITERPTSLGHRGELLDAGRSMKVVERVDVDAFWSYFARTLGIPESSTPR